MKNRMEQNEDVFCLHRFQGGALLCSVQGIHLVLHLWVTQIEPGQRHARPGKHHNPCIIPLAILYRFLNNISQPDLLLKEKKEAGLQNTAMANQNVKIENESHGAGQ